PETVLQPEPADSGAPHSITPEHDERRARGTTGSGAAATRSALLRADPQPRARDDAARHRREEPQDAARIGVEPTRVQRAARARPRERRRLQAGRRQRRAHPAPGTQRPDRQVDASTATATATATTA